jgi:butyryl-CoA dehydrogenase
LALLLERIAGTVRRAAITPLRNRGDALAAASAKLSDATRAAWSTDVPEEALANATPYMQAFGHVVVAWLWLDVALTSLRLLEAGHGDPGSAFQLGKLQAMHFFFDFELPKIDPWLAVTASRNPVCREMREEWF